MYEASTERPGLDESYLVATSSSNLTLNPDATCAATHLIAAGLLGNRMGQALVHLRAEWDTADKPRKAIEADVAQRAQQLPKRKGKPDLKRARLELMVAHAGAMRARAHQMRGWLPAMVIMQEWAQGSGVDPDLLSPALYHWLNPCCPVCEGRAETVVAGTPSLSGKQCLHCAGTGKWPRPLGAELIHDWMKRCLGKAKKDHGVLVRNQAYLEAGEVRRL